MKMPMNALINYFLKKEKEREVRTLGGVDLHL